MSAPKFAPGRLPKAEFKSGKGGRSYVCWSKGGSPFAYYACNGMYIQLALANEVDRLVKDVDASVKSVKTVGDRLDKLEAAGVAKEAEAMQQATDQDATVAALRARLEELERARLEELQERHEMVSQQALEQAMERAEVAAMRVRLELSTERAEIADAVLQTLREDLENMDKKAAFFTIYKMKSQPQTLDDMRECMRRFARASARIAGVPDANITLWVDQLMVKMTDGTRPTQMTEIQFAGAKLWTTDSSVMGAGNRRVTLYGSLTRACREDTLELLLEGGIELMKGINSTLVGRTGHIPRLLPDPNWANLSYRGTGIDPSALQFWQNLLLQPQGRRKYRVPMPLASSLERTVAEGFLGQVPANLVHVMMIFQWPPLEECLHAAFIDRVSDVPGEAEMLLAAYSVVELRALDETTSPITMTIDVMVDNRSHPEYLPVTAWH